MVFYWDFHLNISDQLEINFLVQIIDEKYLVIFLLKIKLRGLKAIKKDRKIISLTINLKILA